MPKLPECASIAANLVSSICIVFANKWVFSIDVEGRRFVYGSALTLIHFLATALGLGICIGLGVFRPIRLPLLPVTQLSLFFCGFVVLTNLSLAENSVGFYQLAKVLTTPTIVLLGYLRNSTVPSRPILLSLLIICLGVAILSFSDVQLTTLGLFYALSGVLVTSEYQIHVGQFQKELNANPMQLLLYQAPISAGFLLVLVAVEEALGLHAQPLLEFEWNQTVASLVMLSALLAFAVNLSTFFLIGLTSPLTYNVVGHLKLTLIVVGGVLLFHESLDRGGMLGIALALGGVFWYTAEKLKPPPPQREAV